jgi:drug/metabolite transporter (DMT)-like permease
MIGVTAVLIEACLSGFANVYFESVVKSTPLSIWHRNVQLAVWSLCVFVPRAIYDGNGTPLAGWDGLAVGNTLVGALGGILVALCIAHFDSIAKAVAVTLSVVLTVLGGYALLNGPMSMQLALASAVVVTSTINYSFG